MKIRSLRCEFRGSRLIFIALACLVSTILPGRGLANSWRDAAYSAVLVNRSLRATFQAGQLIRLEDLRTAAKLVDIDPKEFPSKLPVFGSDHLDLETCQIKQTLLGSRVFTHIVSPDGREWNISWRIEQASGDLVLNASFVSQVPMEEMRVFVLGAGIRNYRLVWVHGYGTGNVSRAPVQGPICLGDPLKDGSPFGFSHPLVALFEGEKSGWFIEGREPRVGPACLMISGEGEQANLGFVRRFPFPRSRAEMYEIRIRTYQGNWADAVDPYVEWLEKGAGFLALEKLPRMQRWIAKLKSQAYVATGDYRGLEELARRVNPQETLIGRQGDLRPHPFDIAYPDYRLSKDARKWVRRARELGFHVGMHFNIGSVSVMYTDLMERFRPGMQPIGKDAEGNEDYLHIYEGPNRLYRVSAALKEWREYLIAQMKDAVEAGVDVIYLDEAMAPHGRPVVGDMDGYQGALLLMKEILRAYPHVGIETEQFNPLTAKFGKLALSQMPLGHPLSGYIFHKFVRVVPEGVMYSPTEGKLMDAFDSWGFMLPGADTAREDSWVEIAAAFHMYGLVPDVRLPRKKFKEYAEHYTHGVLPVDEGRSWKAERLFGFRGRGGVVAYFEKHPNKRGLVVYEPGKQPKWFGVRYWGIRSYPGPGLPCYYSFRQQVRDWIIYDGKSILGLDPNETYWFDEKLAPSPTRFHIYRVPKDFVGVTDMESRTPSQEIGKDDNYFFLRFAGHGTIGIYVPEGYDVYLDGDKLEVDPMTRTATALVNTSFARNERLTYHIELSPDEKVSEDKERKEPSTLMAFRRMDTELRGNWADLPLLQSPDSLKWIKRNSANGFSMSAGAVGRFIGKIPRARKVRLQGSYRMNEEGTGTASAGVVRVNGIEILRVEPGDRPFRDIPLDVDISSYAGQYVLLEFGPLGSPGRGNSAVWNNPRFVIEGEETGS